MYEKSDINMSQVLLIRHKINVINLWTFVQVTADCETVDKLSAEPVMV